MRKLILTVLTGAALIASADLASAQRRRGKRIGKIFAKLDANKDGKITEQEAGKAWARLERADANNDGAVTKEELAKAGKKRRGKRRKKKRG